MTAPVVEAIGTGPLELSCTQSGGIAAVRASGELDAMTSHRMRRLLTDLLRQPVTRIALDLSAVNFMDSAGLGALLASRGAAERVGIDLVIDESSPQVARVLELTGTSTRFAG